MTKEQFDWIPFYTEFAEKILPYKDRRSELVQIIKEVYENIQMSLPKLEKDGAVFDIDPFTVYGLFNKGITNANRISIIKGFAQTFNMVSSIPENFDGVPVLNNQKATYYWFVDERGDNDIDNLWDVFSTAVDYAKTGSEASRKAFISSYDLCIGQKGVRWNLSMGLFWAAPYKYLNLDSRNREFLKDSNNMPADFISSLGGLNQVPSGEKYLDICESIVHIISENSEYQTIPELSAYAWQKTSVNNSSNSKENVSSAAFLRWMQPLLNALKKLGGSATPKDARNQIILDENLSEEEVSELRGKTNVNKFENEVAFARNYLVYAGYISNEQHGIWTLTPEGNTVEIDAAMASQIFKDGIKKSKENGISSSVDNDVETTHYWLYTPGEGSVKWNDYYREGIMGIGWGDAGDLKSYMSKSEMSSKMKEIFHATGSFKNAVHATWQFANVMKTGDVVFVKKGTTKIIGRGVITSDYEYDESREDDYKNIRHVNWTNKGEWDHPGKAVVKTLTDITQYTEYVEQLKALFEDEEEIEDTAEIVTHTPYTKDDFLGEVYMDDVQYQTLVGLLQMQKNIILQGAPGVGKTFAAKRLAYSIMGVKDPSRVMVVQFHQSYSYEDFIMGYRPTENGGFRLEPGAFYSFCKKAEEDSENSYFFIIDEINRGNLSKIFGELFMLIEKDKRGPKNQIRLLYKDELFHVPENIFLIGMMNTADRSLAMLDYALRRRFVFFEMTPAFDSDGFKEYRQLKDNEKFDRLIAAVQGLNVEIENDESLGTGFRIGHSYFCLNDDQDVTDEWLMSVVEFQIIPLLKEYWFDESSKVNDWSDTLRRAIK